MTEELILNPITKIQIDAVIKNTNIQSVGISGNPGSGKKHLSEYLAKKALKIDNLSTYPYLVHLDCEEVKVGIEQVREIKKFLELKIPSEKSTSRCIILNNIEFLGEPAQNALLKTIEEPPAGTVIIITVGNKNLLLPTISSRLQWINVKPISSENLRKIPVESKSAEDVKKALILSEGNVGDFLKFVNSETETDSYINAVDYAKTLLKKTRLEKLSSVDAIIKNSDFTIDELMRGLTKIIRTLILNSKDPQQSKVLVKKLDLINDTRYLAGKKLSSKLILTRLFNQI